MTGKTMNILIVNPPIRLTDKPRHIPHGLAIIANLIRKKVGVVPAFLDLNAFRYPEDRLRGIFSRYDFDVVLIGGLIPVYKRIIKYSAMLKGINPKAVIIAGGSAAMSVPELLFNNSMVDVVCAGEGERAIVNLLNGLKCKAIHDLLDTKGFYFKTPHGIHFSGAEELIESLDEESDLPAYDLLPMDIYLQNPVVGFGRDIDFISSRGCPFQCTFCYQPWGRRFRGHSVDFIIDALLFLKKTYRVDFVSFQDDEFMARKNRVVEFCEKIRRTVPDLLWSCTGRVNLVDDGIIAEMRRSGCVSISYGLESGSARMLASMKKRAGIAEMEAAIAASRRHGLMLPVSFIIGMPGETTESCRETVEFCVRNQIPLKSMMFATPYPGTALFDFALETGRIGESNVHDYVLQLEDARDFTINLTDAFSDEELIAKREEMMAEVAGRLKPISVRVYREKLAELFGPLANGQVDDPALQKHRAEHGGIDVF